MKSIVNDITRAWNELDPELIVRHLSPDFRYDSQWVFAYLTYDGYVEYIRGKFKTLRERGIPRGPSSWGVDDKDCPKARR